MSTKKSNKSNLKIDDANSPISQGNYGLKYVPLNRAGKQALIELKEWIAKQTGKSLTYNATIIYLRDFLFDKPEQQITKEELKSYLQSLKKGAEENVPN